ncbi:MAG TPA: ATP-binding protein [Thermoanaerobaculia bacterium]|nr:ATP-binding protein [Thermoanaerobaculia bacterium]
MEVSVRLEREIAALDDLFATVERFVADERLDEKTGLELAVVLEELFTNAVQHNPGGSGDLRITLRRDSGEIVLTLTDPDTDPFDLASEPPPDLFLPLAHRRPGGLGVHLVRSFVDRIECDWREREGTITLIKTLG